LEKTGVLDALTKVLVGLYEEPDRPSNALEYMRRYLGAPAVAVDVDGLRRENEELKFKVEKLKKQLASAATATAPTANNNNSLSAQQQQQHHHHHKDTQK
jgi:regulator of replication initiation timing